MLTPKAPEQSANTEILGREEFDGRMAYEVKSLRQDSALMWVQETKHEQ